MSKTTLPNSQDTDNPAVQVVAYASKSSKDEHDSIPTQLQEIDAAIARQTDGERVVVAGPFQEEARSGWKGDRGPELEAALRAVEAAAAEGIAELWVWKSERLARGSGKRDEARSLLEVYTRCKRAGVVLRSVLDDAYVQDEAMIGMASKMANKYSEDLSAAVRAGKRRQRERGEIHGGTVCDGFALIKDEDASRYALDPERQDTIARLFALALEGLPARAIAKQLNAEGFRTARGGTWDRRNVEDKLTNAFYAGAVVYFRGTEREEVNWTPTVRHPGYLSREDFEGLAQMRRHRDRARGSNRSPKGRPPTNHMLANLLPCPSCGGRMIGITSPYRRKRDGGRARKYRCEEVHRATGVCDQRDLRAEPIEATLAVGLRGLFADNFDHWLDGLTAQRSAERDGFECDLARQREALAEARRMEGKMADEFARHVDGGNEARAEAAADAKARQRKRAEQLEAAIRDLEDALAESAEAAPVDRMLDFWNDLRRGIDTALDSGSVAAVNAALRERFVAFHVHVADDGTVSITPELPRESPAVVVWDSPEGERPDTDDPEAWAAFYEANPLRTARLATFDNAGNGEVFPVAVEPSQNPRTTQE